MSGLNQRFAKPSYGVNLYREFESLPLRKEVQKNPAWCGIFVFECDREQVAEAGLAGKVCSEPETMNLSSFTIKNVEDPLEEGESGRPPHDTV